MEKIISQRAIERRRFWVEEIRKLSGHFGDDSSRVEAELIKEIHEDGLSALVDHLRLCGDIPESYEHDSSEEKLYSKYTDAILSITFNVIGVRSKVLTERADAADVLSIAKTFSFVSDAKSFRLSRTAKNQKDFKVQAMDGWRGDSTYAMVVCPIYQLPTKSSQIYQQASMRNVCILTYSHLAMLVSFSIKEGKERAEELLLAIFRTVSGLTSSKDAKNYWGAINSKMLCYSEELTPLWEIEKKAAEESIAVAKEVAILYLSCEEERISKMSHEDAIKELIRVHKFANKKAVINDLSDNGILDLR